VILSSKCDFVMLFYVLVRHFNLLSCCVFVRFRLTNFLRCVSITSNNDVDIFNVVESNTFVLSHVYLLCHFFGIVHDFILFGFTGVTFALFFFFFYKLHYSWSV